MPIVLFLSLLFSVGGVQGEELTIEITRGVADSASPIAVVPFGTQMPVTEDMAGIIAGDLKRSGRFEVPSPQSYPQRPSELSQVNFSDWRSVQVDHLVVGQIRPGPGGDDTVQFQLANIFDGKPLLERSYNVHPQQLRRLAHVISDLIYQTLTGEPGAFDSRIAYVTANRGPGGTDYALMVADSDGYNPQVVLRSREPLMSPAWSPDGNRLAYVSFEGRHMQIVVQDIYSGARSVVASFPGINGAPAWSPNGQRLAFALSRDGNPEIYVYNLTGGGLLRVTNNSAIDTEPAWTPDGNNILFTSDRGGSPQIYEVSAAGGQPRRLTFEGDYNARPSVSSDGRYMAMVQRRGGVFYIAVQDLQNGQVRLLSEGGLDESPSFAPNGRMVIYATSEGRGRGVLAAVSVDGRVRQRLQLRSSDVREPAWSPLGR
ncbi:MAG: Tol-Pal system beta propeller repeat protein TolB [Gammaproteobacteria bacterium]|nr:Tol-Pal system beta propeller repeat protein TolB [Gammaproteobacteria bacterium]MCP5425069.1 Tol-Pal system beta propeller repeat protein TolB [Gammaproteobacteria bacterium]